MQLADISMHIKANAQEAIQNLRSLSTEAKKANSEINEAQLKQATDQLRKEKALIKEASAQKLQAIQNGLKKELALKQQELLKQQAILKEAYAKENTEAKKAYATKEAQLKASCTAQLATISQKEKQEIATLRKSRAEQKVDFAHGLKILEDIKKRDVAQGKAGSREALLQQQATNKQLLQDYNAHTNDLVSAKREQYNRERTLQRQNRDNAIKDAKAIQQATLQASRQTLNTGLNTAQNAFTTQVNTARANATQQAQRIQAQTTQQLSALTAQYNTRVQQLTTSLTTQANAIKINTAQIRQLGASMTQIGRTLTFSLTMPLIMLERTIIGTGASFEQQMDKVKAKTQASSLEMAILEGKARELGKTTVKTATESAKAMELLGLAGFEVNEILEAVDSVVKLSIADGLTLEQTTSIVADGLKAMGLSAKDTTRFVDVLATVSTNTNTDIEKLGESFKYSASIAGALGYSVEDVGLALGILADNGIKANRGGTGLRAILNGLASPTAKQAEALRELNISLTDTEGNTLDLYSMLVQLRGAFSGLSEAQQMHYARVLATKTGMNALLAIANTTQSSFDDLANSILYSNGAVNTMATTMADNLKGQFTLLKSNLQEAMLQLTELQEGPLKSLIVRLNETVNSFNMLSDATKSNIIVTGAIAVSVGPLLLLFGTLTKCVASVASSVGLLIKMFKALNTAMAGNPYILATTVALTALASAIGMVTAQNLKNELMESKRNETLREAIKLKKDYTTATKEEIDLLKMEAQQLQTQISNFENFGDRLLELQQQREIVMREIGKMDELWGTKDFNTEQHKELLSQIDQIDKAIVNLGRNRQKQLDDMNEHGGVNTSKELQNAYIERLKNISKAQEFCAQFTTKASKAMAEQVLQTETNIAIAKEQADAYKILTEKEYLNAEQSSDLDYIKKELINTYGQSISYIDQETGAIRINQIALQAQIQQQETALKARKDYMTQLQNIVNTNKGNEAKSVEAQLTSLHEQKAIWDARYTEAKKEVERIQALGYQPTYTDEAYEKLKDIQSKISETEARIQATKEFLGKNETEAASIEELFKERKGEIEISFRLGEIDDKEYEAKLKELESLLTNPEDFLEFNDLLKGEMTKLNDYRAQVNNYTLHQEIEAMEKVRDTYVASELEKADMNKQIVDKITSYEYDTLAEREKYYKIAISKYATDTQTKLKLEKDLADRKKQALEEEKRAIEDKKRATEDYIRSKQEDYNIDKTLNSKTARAQLNQLKELKKFFNSTLKLQAEYTDFALGDSIGIVEAITKQEELSLYDKIALYEENRDFFCKTEEQRVAFNAKIQDIILAESEKLNKNLENLTTDEVNTAINAQKKLIELAKTKGADIEKIEKNIQALKEANIKKEITRNKDAVDTMLKERKRLLDADKKAIDEAAQKLIAPLQAEKDRISKAKELAEYQKQIADYQKQYREAMLDGDTEKAINVKHEWEQYEQDRATDKYLAELDAKEQEILANAEKQKTLAEKNYEEQEKQTQALTSILEEVATLRGTNPEATEESLIQQALVNLTKKYEDEKTAIQTALGYLEAYPDIIKVIQGQNFEGDIKGVESNYPNMLMGLLDGVGLGDTSLPNAITAFNATTSKLDQQLLGMGKINESLYTHLTTQQDTTSKLFDGIINKISEIISFNTNNIIEAYANTPHNVDAQLSIDGVTIAKALYSPFKREGKLRGDF